MDYLQVMTEFGEAIADRVAARVEEDYGTSGYDRFVNKGMNKELIEEYIDEVS